MAQSTLTASTLVDANLFDVVGPINLSYSRTSISGVPLLSYRDAELDLSFQGEDIISTATPVGELITVTLENVADAFIRTFTLVLPTIRLAPGETVEFETLGIETNDRSGAFVPQPGPTGVLQTQLVHQLRVSGQNVSF